VKEIHEGIVEISGIALENGAKVLLMTIPECGVRSEELDRERDELNSLILNDGRDGVYVIAPGVVDVVKGGMMANGK